MKARLDQRRACRRSRRQRHTRYRPGAVPQPASARWLAAALAGEPHRQHADLGGAAAPLVSGRRAISLELVKFDTQLMQNAEIGGRVPAR